MEEIYLPGFLSEFTPPIQNGLLFFYVFSHDIPIMTLSKDRQNYLATIGHSIEETWLHTTGNLTLTGYNSEYGNWSFEDKGTIRSIFFEKPHLNNGPVKFKNGQKNNYSTGRIPRQSGCFCQMALYENCSGPSETRFPVLRTICGGNY